MRLWWIAGLVAPAAAWAQCSESNLTACPSPLFDNVRAAQVNGLPPATVSGVFVATSGGLSGTVAASGGSLTVTLATTVTGIVKGNGSGFLAATPGTDYLAPNGSGAALTGVTFSQIAPAAADGQVPIGTGAGMVLTTITAGANVSVVNAPGSITISAAAAPPMSATTGAIGGSALAAGVCASGTVGVTGASPSSSVVTVTPQAYPGDGFYALGYVSSANVVTVKVCAAVAGTPGASDYNVRVF